MSEGSIESILLLEDTVPVQKVLEARLRELEICWGTVIWRAFDSEMAIDYIDKKPQLALLDVYSPQVGDCFRVLDLLRRNSRRTNILLMSDTGQNDAWFAARAKMAGACFVAKSRLLWSDPQELHDIIAALRDGRPVPWDEAVRQAMAQIVFEYERSRRPPEPLQDEWLIGIEPSFSPRERDFIDILRVDPEMRLTHDEIAERLGIATVSEREYPARISKRILVELGWMEEGALNSHGLQQLQSRGYLSKDATKPEYNMQLVVALLRLIKYIV